MDNTALGLEVSDWEFSDESDGDEREPDVDLDSIYNSKTFHLNLRSTYTTGWHAWEAFRELVQNW